MGRKVILSCDGEGCTETCSSERPWEVSWLCRTIADEAPQIYAARDHQSLYYCPRCALKVTPPVQEPLRSAYEEFVRKSEARLTNRREST